MEIEGYSHCKFYSVVVQRGVGLSFSPLPLLRRKGSHAFVRNFGGTTLTKGEPRLLRPLPTASSLPLKIARLVGYQKLPVIIRLAARESGSRPKNTIWVSSE